MTQTKTVSGRQCQMWSRQWPHYHDDSFGDKYGNKRGCVTENADKVDSNGEPWCYTTDFHQDWETCSSGTVLNHLNDLCTVLNHLNDLCGLSHFSVPPSSIFDHNAY